MRIIIFSLMATICFAAGAQIDYWNSMWGNDTIHFNSRRLILNLPERSIERSTQYIFKGEGMGMCYPLRVSFNNEGSCRMEVLMIDQIVNTSYDRLVFNKDLDVELWNTFNMDNLGSRCFIKDGKYSRIDALRFGIVVYYENLSPEMSEIANQIIKSISTNPSESMEESTTKRKRRVQIIE